MKPTYIELKVVVGFLRSSSQPCFILKELSQLYVIFIYFSNSTVIPPFLVESAYFKFVIFENNTLGAITDKHGNAVKKSDE